MTWAPVMAAPQKSAIGKAPGPILQRKCACENKAEQDEAEPQGMLQRKTAGLSHVATVPAVVHQVLNSSGQPLDAHTRSFMETRFGHDFSRVRIHADDRAARSANSVDALAYTVGQHIVFCHGQYNPASSSGRHLLAHELTHVVQQRGQPPLGQHEMQLGAPHDSLEYEADRIAGQVIAGNRASVESTSRGTIQRQHASTGCTPATTGVNNGEAMIEQARQGAIPAVGGSLAELARPTPQTLLALDRYFHCPSPGDMHQITFNFRRIRNLLPSLEVHCLGRQQAACQRPNWAAIHPGQFVEFCPSFFTGTADRQIFNFVAVAARFLGLEGGLDPDQTIDFTIPASSMVDRYYAYALFASEGTGAFVGPVPATIPCRPVDTGVDVVVPPGAIHDVRLIHRLSATRSDLSQPAPPPGNFTGVESGAVIRRVYRDRSGHEFIYERRLPGATVALPGEEPRFYLPNRTSPL